MKSVIIITSLIFSLNVFSQTEKLKIDSDLANIEGKWTGKLTYLDYTSGEPYTMPADVEVIKIDNYNFIYKSIYPNEPKANSTDTLKISNDGKLFNDNEIKKINRSKNSTQIITEVSGTDGNDKKPATIKTTYFISLKKFTIVKEVKFIGEKNYIKRHEYSFFKN